MMRTIATVLVSLIGKLPNGWALGHRGGGVDAVLGAIAGPIADVEAEAAALMDETDPRSAVNLLPDFERVLGPDPCGRDLNDRTLEQRQRQAHQRWTARGGQSIPYYLGIAEGLGETVEIEEFWPTKVGVLCAGMALIPEGEQFTYRIKLALISQWLFRASQNVAGDPLGGYGVNDVECELRRLKPAHTQLVFAYI